MKNIDVEKILTELNAIDLAGEDYEDRARKRREALLAWLAEKPTPEPTYLERLPEKVRGSIYGWGIPDDGLELIARAIWESRDETFAAGEPTGKLLLSECGFSGCDSGASVDISYNYDKTWLGISRCGAQELPNPDALRLARRIAAISLREGGAA